MSSKRVWAVAGYYRISSNKAKYSRPLNGIPIEHSSLEEALEDVAYMREAGFGSSMRSYVVHA